MIAVTARIRKFSPKQQAVFFFSILCLIALGYYLVWRNYFSEGSWYGDDNIEERIQNNNVLLDSIVRRGNGAVKPIIRVNPYREPLYTTPLASYFMVSKLYSIFENMVTFRSKECQNKFEATCLKKDFISLLHHLKKISSESDRNTVYLILEDDTLVCKNMHETVEKFQNDATNCLYACGVGGTCIMMKPSCFPRVLRQYAESPKRHMDMVLWGVPHMYLHSADHFARVSTMGHNDGRSKCCESCDSDGSIDFVHELALSISPMSRTSHTSLHPRSNHANPSHYTHPSTPSDHSHEVSDVVLMSARWIDVPQIGAMNAILSFSNLRDYAWNIAHGASSHPSN